MPSGRSAFTNFVAGDVVAALQAVEFAVELEQRSGVRIEHWLRGSGA